MPFFRKTSNHKNRIKYSRQPSPQCNLFCCSEQKDYQKFKNFCKRVSLSVSLILKSQTSWKNKRSYRVSASMTLEAAAILPLLLFFILNLSSTIELLRLHGNLAMALRDTGNEMSVYAYAYQQLRETGDDNASQKASLIDTLAGVAFSYAYVRQELEEYLGAEYLESSPLTEGKNGIYFLKSDFMEKNDCIDLVIAYQVSPLFAIPGLSSFQMTNHFYGRAWTGYDVGQVQQDQTDVKELVAYVAENGTVWHKTKDCTYLSLSVRSASYPEKTFLRNKNGQIYIPCELCTNATTPSIIYLTDYGNKFHYVRNCPGLKRTVYSIPLSEAYQYRPCSRCT